MKTIFDKNTRAQLISRIEKLTMKTKDYGESECLPNDQAFEYLESMPVRKN